MGKIKLQGPTQSSVGTTTNPQKVSRHYVTAGVIAPIVRPSRRSVTGNYRLSNRDQHAFEAAGIRPVGDPVKLGRNTRTSFIICVPPAQYEDLDAITIKRNIERLTRGKIHIDTPHWGVGGRLWIPVNDDPNVNGTVSASEVSSDDLVGLDDKLELGKWAENRLKEAQRFARLVRAGRPPETLREQFAVLFTDVIDRLTQPRRESLFENAQRLLMKIPDLMEYIADVKGLKGPTLGDYRSDFRRSMKSAPTVTPSAL